MPRFPRAQTNKQVHIVRRVQAFSGALCELEFRTLRCRVVSVLPLPQTTQYEQHCSMITSVTRNSFVPQAQRWKIHINETSGEGRVPSETKWFELACRIFSTPAGLDPERPDYRSERFELVPVAVDGICEYSSWAIYEVETRSDPESVLFDWPNMRSKILRAPTPIISGFGRLT
jgi:hypothetical protein